MARFCVDVKQLIFWFSVWLEKSILQVLLHQSFPSLCQTYHHCLFSPKVIRCKKNFFSILIGDLGVFLGKVDSVG